MNQDLQAQMTAPEKESHFLEILTYIGGAIVFTGISIFLGQNFETMNIFTKVLTTLGSGLAAYGLGVLFHYKKPQTSISNALFLISSLCFPVGLFIIFDYAGFDMSSPSIQLATSLILFITYLLSDLLLKKTIFAAFALIYGTWSYYSFINQVMSLSDFSLQLDIYRYNSLAIGFTYILIGRYFESTYRKALTGYLYFFGIWNILSVTFSFGSYFYDLSFVDESLKSSWYQTFWDFFYPVVLLTVFYFSTILKSRAFLFSGAAFTFFYIIRLTSTYFAESLGWPLSLVLIGLSLIFLGYVYYEVKKRYLDNKLSNNSVNTDTNIHEGTLPKQETPVNDAPVIANETANHHNIENSEHHQNQRDNTNTP